MSTLPAPGEELDRHRSFLWGLCYRLSGNAADAEDLVQDTFLRALERPPRRRDLPWRPWLVRVAVNLGRDHLRRRRRRRYAGPWLPGPVEGPEPRPVSPAETADPAASPAARYDLVESASYAFLVALEALTPTQRAVLLLRDVLEYSVRETSRALDVSEANVKTSHLRARRAMEAYDRERRRPGPELRERTARALERFLAALAAGDAAGVEALLAADVRSFSDAGGDFAAALVPVVGRERVARFFLGLRDKLGGPPRVQVRDLNGLPALVVDVVEPRPRWAPRTVVLVDVDADGRIRKVYGVLARRKLAGLRP